MDITTKARILITTPGMTITDLNNFSSHLDAKDEDLFWAEIRKFAPTLCADW